MPFDDLRARYLENRLVAFVGAGVSAAGGLPSWSGLIQHVLADARAAASAAEFPALDEAEATLTRGDLIRALSEVQASTTSTIFNRAVSRALDDSRHAVVPTLAQAIAGLAPTLHAVVTTNLDRFLERAFSGNWPSFTLPDLDLGQQKHYILQLHGNRTVRRSWVLSEREYEDLLYGRPELQRFVEGLFRFHTLLFVGYGLRDPDFDRVCGQLRVFGRGQAPQHFALMPEGKVGNYERHRLADAGIELLTYPNPDGSHAELLRIIKDLAASQPGAITAVSHTPEVVAMNPTPAGDVDAVPRLNTRFVTGALVKSKLKSAVFAYRNMRITNPGAGPNLVEVRHPEGELMDLMADTLELEEEQLRTVVEPRSILSPLMVVSRSWRVGRVTLFNGPTFLLANVTWWQELPPAFKHLFAWRGAGEIRAVVSGAQPQTEDEMRLMAMDEVRTAQAEFIRVDDVWTANDGRILASLIQSARQVRLLQDIHHQKHFGALYDFAVRAGDRGAEFVSVLTEKLPFLLGGA